MTRLAVALLVAAVALIAWSVPALAGDIVTMPTANQMGPGEVDVAQYYISFDYPPVPPGLPGHAYFTTMYVGVTDRIEVDVWYIDANKGFRNITVLNATGLLLSERKGDCADVVIGVRDAGNDLVKMFGAGFDRGLFVAAAKTLNPPAGPPSSANTPIWRLHLGVGDELGLATDIHRMNKGGPFGGVQALVTPEIGAIALWDGTDDIIGVTYTPDPKGPTYKGGVFGDHLWLGVNYTFTR